MFKQGEKFKNSQKEYKVLVKKYQFKFNIFEST